MSDGAVDLFVCAECEATWRSAAAVDPTSFQDLSEKLTEIGVAPAWNSLVEVTPEEWFRDLGYALELSHDSDGVSWVSLSSLSNPEFTVERYGRGDTGEHAAERARKRWQVEQIGSPADNRSNKDRRLP